LAKKGIAVWLFSSLTFIALIHLIEATSILVFGNQTRLLQLYPLINEKLQSITPAAYFWISAFSTCILWGITCTIAFDNPVETFLNKILSDAKKQSAVETQLLEDKSEILDAMYETIESDNEILAQVKDLMCNVRADVKEIQPLIENMDKVKTELGALKKEIKKIDEKVQFSNICSACGKPLLPEFKICPYCGENIKLLPERIVSVKDYR
jgi:RNA polymerase-binding transcription factor DksA